MYVSLLGWFKLPMILGLFRRVQSVLIVLRLGVTGLFAWSPCWNLLYLHSRIPSLILQISDYGKFTDRQDPPLHHRSHWRMHLLHYTPMCHHLDRLRSQYSHHLIRHHPVQIASHINLVHDQHSRFRLPLHSDCSPLDSLLSKPLLAVLASAFSLILLHASCFARGFYLHLLVVCRRAVRWLRSAVIH